MTKQYFLAGASLYNANNKGGEALAYGAIEYLKTKSNNNCKIIIPLFKNQGIKEYKLDIEKTPIIHRYYNKYSYIYSIFELYFNSLFKFPLFSQLAKDIEQSSAIANVNGGDSFSDIYGIKQWINFNRFSLYAILTKKELILLPQTIGPFKNKFIKSVSKYIIKKASEVMVRDNAFEDTLIKWGIKFKIKKDISYYMNPQKIDIPINKPCIGINISSLAYSNNYPGLEGKFNNYKKLITEIITNFQKRNVTIYLIPHTYLVKEDGTYTEDLASSYEAYNNLKDKRNIFIINKSYSASQLKYIISEMNFFIGTRMHSCFAAIFTNTPVFGLAYSYKFSGSFDRYGQSNNYTNITDLKKEKIPEIIEKINSLYEITNKNQMIITNVD